MRIAAVALATGLALGGCADRFAAASPAPDAAPAAPRPRFLVVSYTAGFHHPSIPTAEQTLADLAAQTGELEVSFARTADDVKRMLTPAFLAGYAGVVFANTTGDLGIPDLPAFLAWIADGHAFIGVHSATDTYKDQPSYVDMIGAAFDHHGSPCEVEPKVEDAANPATAHLAPSFRITDEIYIFHDNPRPRVHVLFALDRHPPDGSPEANAPGDYPLAWTKTHGTGRVFYTALGHGDDVWKDDRFRRHLLGAIRWSTAAR